MWKWEGKRGEGVAGYEEEEEEGVFDSLQLPVA